MNTHRRLSFAAGWLVAVVVAIPSLIQAAENRTRSIIIEPPGRRGDFRVNIDTDKSAYDPGDRIRIRFSATDDATVYIFNTDTEGVTRQIFPNYYDRDNRIRGNRTYTMPKGDYTLRVEGPAGSEKLRIIAYRDRWESLGPWHEFRSSDPFPRRSISPEAMNERIKSEVRKDVGRTKTLRIEERGTSKQETLRVVPGRPDYDYDYDEDYAYFNVRRVVYKPYQPPWADDYDSRWRDDYDYRRPYGAYEPDPRRATARVRVYSSPSEADVYIDGIYRGRTPDTFRVEPGRREVLVYHPKYGSRSADLNMSAGSTSSVSLSLGR